MRRLHLFEIEDRKPLPSVSPSAPTFYTSRGPSMWQSKCHPHPRQRRTRQTIQVAERVGTFWLKHGVGLRPPSSPTLRLG